MTTPTKRGPGRPPLAEGAEPARLSVRLAPDDHALVKAAAERAGVSIAEYLRAAAVARAKRDARR